MAIVTTRKGKKFEIKGGSAAHNSAVRRTMKAGGSKKAASRAGIKAHKMALAGKGGSAGSDS